MSTALNGNISDNKIPVRAPGNQFVEVGHIKLGSHPGNPSQSENESPKLSITRNDMSDFRRIVDVNVEPERLYAYRLELFEDVGRVERIYSTSFFQEKIEKPAQVCSISIDSDYSDGFNEAVSFRVNVTIKETDAEKVFKSLLEDKFDLFQDEIRDIGSLTTDAIAVKIEKIDIDLCTIDTVAYLSNLASTTPNREDVTFNPNSVSVVYTDTNSPAKDCLYKATACLKPVSEIIAGIEDEITLRKSPAAGVKYDKFKFAKIRKKIEKLETNVLYTLSSKLAASSGFKKNVIVDSETSAGMSGQNYFARSSTGDMSYYLHTAREPIPVYDFGKDKPASGCYNFETAEITHYPEKSLRQIKTSNKTKNKFIIDFRCIFKSFVDYCSIFVHNNGFFEHCCDIHVPSFLQNGGEEKSSYKALVEKEGLQGTCVFYAYPVTKYGKILSKLNLGSIEV